MNTRRPCVIFDVDGVLVDSYQAHFQSWLALAEERGCHKMTEEEFRATFGRTSRETIIELWPGSLPPAELVSELDDRKEELFREMMAADFRPIPGAVDLIETLAMAGFGLAAGSSGPPENVHLVVDQLGCRKHFDAVVTGVDVTRGKPDPEVFLTCAERLGSVASDCAVIEDAVVGIEAAKKAGTFAIAFVDEGRDVGLFDEADHIVRDLRALSPASLRRWIAGRS